MIDFFMGLSHPLQALVATLFTWGVTALGASLVFLFKRVNKLALDIMLAVAGGVMLSASFWSLLMPSIEMAENLNMNIWLPSSIGFFCGGLLLYIGDKIFTKIKNNNKNIVNRDSKRTTMFILSIVLHNIPEGLAVGVAFGSIAYNLNGATLMAACLIALGIGIQNFPEGAAVSLPLRRDGYSRSKAFFYGQLSGIVEPISGVLGALLVLKMRVLLPFLLAFAAGAMIYVIVQEIIPESQTSSKKDLMTLFTIVGFLIMMILDISLG